jgi:hypothetical protein
MLSSIPGIILPESGWYPEGSELTFSVPETVGESEGVSKDTEYRLKQWKVIGYYPAKEQEVDAANSQIIVDGSYTITAIFDVYYALTASIPESCRGFEVSGLGFYLEGAEAEWSVTPTSLPTKNWMKYLGAVVRVKNSDGTEIMNSPKIVRVECYTDYAMLYIAIMILSLLGTGLIYLQAAPGRAKGKQRKTITKADLKHAIDQGKQKQFISPEKLLKEHPELKTEKDRADKVKEIWRDAVKDSGERYSLEQAIKILEQNKVNLEQKEKLLDKEKKKIIDEAQKDFEKHLEKLSEEEGVPVEELRKEFTVETSEEHKKTIKEYDESIQTYKNRIKERNADSEKNKEKLETVINQQKKRFSTYGVFGDQKLEEKANALLAWSNGKMNLKWSLVPKGTAGRGLAWILDTALDLSAIPAEYRRELIHNLKVVVKGKSGKDVTVTQGGDYRHLNEAAPNTTGVIMEPKVGTTEFIWYPLPGNVAFWYLDAQGKKLRKDIRDEDLSIPFRQLFHIHLPTALDAKDVNFEFWADDPRTPETDRILIGKGSIPQKDISKASKGGKKNTGLQSTTIKNMIKP